MVCRECGAYNAEHLTHCRVCAAKLRDPDAAAAETAAQQTPEQEQEDTSRPSRSFVQAPSWPTRAFAGASEPTAYAAPTVSEPAPSIGQSATYTPLMSASMQQRTTVSQQPALSTCPNCGQPALPDAPFCPYCGQQLNAAATAAPVAAGRMATQGQAAAVRSTTGKSATPVKKAAAKRPVDDYDDDDFDDDEFDEDDFDDEPKKKKKAKGKAAKGKRFDIEDDFDDEDEFDDEFDDDDGFDEDDEDFDDMPKKRGKGTTMLFWGLIMLLVALIVVFGIYIVNKNFGGDAGKMFASITSAFGSNKEPQPNGTNGDTPAATDPQADASSLMNTATLTEYTDPETGGLFYDVDIYAPTESTVRIITDNDLTANETKITRDNHLILRVTREAFMPNKPCESETVTITPNIQVSTPTGETYQLQVSDITVTVPKLNLTVDSPNTDTVQQTKNNDPINISGTVDDHNVELYINDQRVDVYSEGIFATTYTPKRPVDLAKKVTADATPAPADTTPAAPADATPAATADDDGEDAADTGEGAAEDTAAPEQTAPAETPAAPAAPGAYPTNEQGWETITIEARKNNYVTARKVIAIEPFVMKDMSMLINNSGSLEADKENSLRTKTGTVTLVGTVTPGAKITLSGKDDSSELKFGDCVVNETGAFSVAVTIPQVGAYDVVLTATQDGYNDTTASAVVEREPDEKYSSFLKRCANLEKDYDKITAGTTVSGNYQDTGKVTEILATEPYTVYRVEIAEGKSIVCVHRSLKSKIDNGDIGQKKQIMGSLKGTYTDGSPYVWVWFSLNK